MTLNFGEGDEAFEDVGVRLAKKVEAFANEGDDAADEDEVGGAEDEGDVVVDSTDWK
jgi:hypothetical protein